MKNLYFILLLLLVACHPVDPQQQQQDFICQSMIQGYLKIQQRSQYQFWHSKIIAPQHVVYYYRPVSEHGMMISTFRQQQYIFECIQQQTLFRLKRAKQPDSLLEIQLPEQKL